MAVVFLETKFWLLILFSVLLPIIIYWWLMARSAISKYTVLMFGMILLGLSGIDFYLLKALANLSKTTTTLLDDKIFGSEITLALYLLPVAFGGVGVNLISHVLIRHLHTAERRFEQREAQQHNESAIHD